VRVSSKLITGKNKLEVVAVCEEKKTE